MNGCIAHDEPLPCEPMREPPTSNESKPLPRPQAPEPNVITTSEELAQLCAIWRKKPALAIDTEFVRERTYFPGLGLVQVGDGTGNHLVDVVAIDDLAPLGVVFREPSVVKVFHACGEDLETLFDRFGAVPTPLFDTQVAAALAGYGPALSYQALTAKLCGVDIPKDATRTNWLRRPLTAAQIRYAGLDIAYLLPIFETLREDLAKRERLPWLEEEVTRLQDVERFLPDPHAVFRRVKGGGRLRPQQLAVLRALAAWREATARRRDQPRSFVVPDGALLQLARDQPQSEDQLQRITDLSLRARQRHGRALLDAIKAGRAVPPGEQPEQPPAPTNPDAARQLVKRLQAAVREVATHQNLPPELLANRKTLAGVVVRAQRGDAILDHPLLRGWRGQLIGDALYQVTANLGR